MARSRAVSSTMENSIASLHASGVPGGLHGLFGTCNLVMPHGQVALYEELIVLRIIDRLLDVLTCEAFDRGPGVPEAQRDEFGAVTFDLPQQPRPAVARRTLIALYPGPLHIRGVSGSIVSPYHPAPDSRDHLRSSCTTATTAGSRKTMNCRSAYARMRSTRGTTIRRVSG